MSRFTLNFSNNLESLYKDSDNDYPTLMKEQCKIENELKFINQNLYISTHEKRDIGELITGTIFILSDNSVLYYNDIDKMIKNKFGSEKYSCSLSVERIPYSKTILASKGNKETVIIKRKTFLNLSPYIHLRIIFIIILITIIIYLIYLLCYYSIN